MTVDLNGVTPLPQLGVIRVQGEDSSSFLQGQLTQDFALLGPEQARLAAWCSPKGRMMASFVGLRLAQDDFLLVCSRDILAPTLKRLSMYVLRAKARLTDASADFSLHGLAGAANPLPADSIPWTHRADGPAHLVALYPADGVPRALRIAPASTPEPAGPALSPSVWAWSEVRSGIATLSAPIVEAFVPQMLNYESVGGVNFRKGCYPGQEVVARSQFRGTIKRRGCLVHAGGELAAGQEVFFVEGDDQPCGIVAQAAPSPAGGFDAIVSLLTSAMDGAPIRAGLNGPALTLLPLPYLLAEDV